jgi:hypothetical protein
MDMLGTYVGVFESLHHLAYIVSDACLKSGLQSGWTDSHLLHAHDILRMHFPIVVLLWSVLQTLASWTDNNAFMHKSNEPYEAEL